MSCHRSEGLGLGLLEAMAMGVPCIATGYGGNTDFMNRDTDLVRAMAAVKTDAALRTRPAANGRRDARQYIDVSKGSRIGSLLQAAYSQSVRQ